MLVACGCRNEEDSEQDSQSPPSDDDAAEENVNAPFCSRPCLRQADPDDESTMSTADWPVEDELISQAAESSASFSHRYALSPPPPLPHGYGPVNAPMAAQPPPRKR